MPPARARTRTARSRDERTNHEATSTGCTRSNHHQNQNRYHLQADQWTLEKMRAFYTEKGIDILKDAVSLPGVSLHYLLRGSIERGAELYSPCKEAYGMLKEAVVGGQSLVFTWYHEAGVTRIRPHRFKQPRVCKRIIGYDANALYLSTMLRDMPCGKEQVTWQRFKAALNDSIDRAENRGFRMVNNRMATYEQQKLGLSAYYDKRRVYPDGIHTEPIEFHMI